MKKLFVCSAVILHICTSPALPTTETQTTRHKHAIDFCPLSPLFNIYAVQYFNSITEKDKLLLGLAYMNIRYEDGTSHAPSILMGYKRYLWKGWHVEYQLWPAFNAYWEKNEEKYYKGFELWNEFRSGYTIDLTIGDQPLYINPQVLFGFGLVQGNKPESFKKTAKEEPLFIAPLIFLGVKF